MSGQKRSARERWSARRAERRARRADLRQRRAAAADTYRSACFRLASATADDEYDIALRDVQAAARHSDLTRTAKGNVRETVYTKTVRAATKGGLSVDVYWRLTKLGEDLELPKWIRHIEEQERMELALARAGNLLDLQGAGLVLHHQEVLHDKRKAALVAAEEHAYPDDYRVLDEGTLFLTSKRFVYLGDGYRNDISLSDILHVEHIGEWGLADYFGPDRRSGVMRVSLDSEGSLLFNTPRVRSAVQFTALAASRYQGDMGLSIG